MAGWLQRNRTTVEIDVAVLLGIMVLVAGLTAFIAARGESGNQPHASVAPHQVMPGHGSVMPSDVRIADRPGTLTVAMGDYWFKPGTHRVRAGRYRFVAHNYGSIPHDIMLAPTPITFESANQPADAGVGLDGMQPGMTRSMKVILTPGRWEFFCSLPGHYASGQHAVLEVVGPMPKGLDTRRSTTMGGSMGNGM